MSNPDQKSSFGFSFRATGSSHVGQNWLWVKNRYPKWSPGNSVATRTNTCGPIPGLFFDPRPTCLVELPLDLERVRLQVPAVSQQQGCGITRGFSNHFCDTSGNPPFYMKKTSLWGSALCITVDSIPTTALSSVRWPWRRPTSPSAAASGGCGTWWASGASIPRRSCATGGERSA